MRAYIVACVAFVLALQVCGCTGVPNVQPVTAEEQQALAVQAVQAPRIQRGDKVKVTVFGEDKLEGTYEVDAAGTISLPLTGSVRAAGLTKEELERALTQKFRTEYLRNPKVTIDIAFRPFYMDGEVNRPGEYPYKAGLNVVSAAAMAGGVTFRARPNVVFIQHAGETAAKEYPMASTVPVLPGDIIRFPPRYF